MGSGGKERIRQELKMKNILREHTYFFRQAKYRVSGTPLCQDIPNQVFLAVVSGEDCNLVRRIALQTHVHKDGHSILRLSQIL